MMQNKQYKQMFTLSSEIKKWHYASQKQKYFNSTSCKKDTFAIMAQQKNNESMLANKLLQAYKKQFEVYFGHAQSNYWKKYKYINPILYNKCLQADIIHQEQRKKNNILQQTIIKLPINDKFDYDVLKNFIKVIMLNIKSNLVITLLEFENVDIFAQGFYYFEITVKSLDEFCPRVYEPQQITSTDEYYIFRSKEIHMKFQNQKISVQQTVNFQIQQLQNRKLDIVISLYKRYLCTQNQNNELYQKIQQQAIEVKNIQFPFVQYSIVKFQYPDLSKLHICALLIPIRFNFQKSIIMKKDQIQCFLKIFSKSNRFHSLTVQKIISQCVSSHTFCLTLPKKFVEKTQQMSEVEVSQEKLCRYFGLYQNLKLDLQQLIQQITNNFDKNKNLLSIILLALKDHSFIFDTLKQKYYKKIKSCYKSNIFTNQPNLEHKKIQQRISRIRKSFNMKSYQNPQSYYFKLLPKSLNMSSPIIVMQTEIIPKQSSSNILFSQKFRNVCIFAHGYMGTCHDIRLIKNAMRQYIGKGTYILLQSYSKIMNQDLEVICQAAASEIRPVLLLNQAKYGNLRIFMVGHSMGGVILRGCFKHLKQFEKYYHAFISLNSPHLGYFQGIKLYIEAALKVLLKFKKSKSIQQLTYKDCELTQQNFIYKLSMEGSLSCFRYLVLLSSSEDYYISWHSSRLVAYQKQKNIVKDTLQKLMLANILKQQNNKMQRIDRIQIDFNASEKKMDDIIGRAAHVNVLGNEKAANMLFTACQHIFSNF